MASRYVDAEVLIVGGGPAGGAAAIACAQRGLSVVVAERDAFSRERPGEGLHPGIEPLLRQLGVDDRLHRAVGARPEGVWIEWGGPRRFEAYGADEGGSWRGFQVDRRIFDALLLERAAELGADVRQPCAVGELILAEGRIAGAHTAEGTVRSRIVIDASGGSRWLPRKLGLRGTAHSPPLTAWYGYVDGLIANGEDAPALIADASGWTWTARVREERYQWVRLDLQPSAGRGSRRPSSLAGLQPTGPDRGADVTWRLLEQPAGEGWFVAGDAAAMLDPTSSHGVLKALMSGMMAAHLTCATLGGAPFAETAAAYRRWLAGWFQADVARLRAMYRAIGAEGFEEPAAASQATEDSRSSIA